jgi:membrane protein YdbS with pleckstrin-like domain
MIDEVRWERLHPGVRKVWLFSTVVSYLIFLLPATLPVFFLTRSWMWAGVACAGVVGLAILSVSLIQRQYELWSYALRADDLLVRKGIFWRSILSIPRLRIQHVDVHSGPIDRSLGLVQLSVYTAGAPAAVATIPGLAPHEAESLRTALLATATQAATQPPPHV